MGVRFDHSDATLYLVRDDLGNSAPNGGFVSNSFTFPSRTDVISAPCPCLAKEFAKCRLAAGEPKSARFSQGKTDHTFTLIDSH